MPRGKMSAEGRAKIAAAQRKRWAARRAAMAAGTLPPAKKPGRKPGRPPMAATSTGARRGRPPKSAGGGSSSSSNPFMNMTVQALVTARRNVEEAWNATLSMLGLGQSTGRRGRPRKKK